MDSMSKKHLLWTHYVPGPEADTTVLPSWTLQPRGVTWNCLPWDTVWLASSFPSRLFLKCYLFSDVFTNHPLKVAPSTPCFDFLLLLFLPHHFSPSNILSNGNSRGVFTSIVQFYISSAPTWHIVGAQNIFCFLKNNWCYSMSVHSHIQNQWSMKLQQRGWGQEINLNGGVG